jgi:hypothetical protein
VRLGRGVRCGSYRVLGPFYVLRCNSVVVGEGACVRDCRGIGQMGVLCGVGTAKVPRKFSKKKVIFFVCVCLCLHFCNSFQ